MPEDYKAGDGKKYPALLVTDGDFTFGSVYESASTLRGQITPLIIISVGTSREEGEAEHVRRRIYEFSPPGWDRKDPFRPGGGALLQERSEVAPGSVHWRRGQVPDRDQYRDDPFVGRQVPHRHRATRPLWYFGRRLLRHLGNLSAQYTVQQVHHSSPATRYGNGETFRQEADYAKTHKDLAVGVYMAAGSLEATTPEVEVLGETVSGMSHLAGVLASRHYPGLKLTVEYHPGMNHNDVIGTTVVRGLRTLY